MKPDPRLHHYCQNISKGYLETVIEMYALFNCRVVYRPPKGQGWAMVGQDQLRFAIQIAEVEDKPIADINQKKKVHVAFISDDPKGLISKVEKWASSKNLKFREGGWSPIERYFDLSDIFVNFVVEVMHTTIEKE